MYNDAFKKIAAIINTKDLNKKQKSKITGYMTNMHAQPGILAGLGVTALLLNKKPNLAGMPLAKFGPLAVGSILGQSIGSARSEAMLKTNKDIELNNYRMRKAYGAIYGGAALGLGAMLFKGRRNINNIAKAQRALNFLKTIRPDNVRKADRVRLATTRLKLNQLENLLSLAGRSHYPMVGGILGGTGLYAYDEAKGYYKK